MMVDDRIGNDDEDAAFDGRLAQPLLGRSDGLVQRIDAVAPGEIVVDQLLPLLLSGGEALIAQHARHVGVVAFVGTVHVLRFEEDEPVEKPLFAALLIDIGDIGFEPPLVPQIGVAVVAVAVAQHGVGGRRPSGAPLPRIGPGARPGLSRKRGTRRSQKERCEDGFANHVHCQSFALFA